MTDTTHRSKVFTHLAGALLLLASAGCGSQDNVSTHPLVEIGVTGEAEMSERVDLTQRNAGIVMGDAAMAPASVAAKQVATNASSGGSFEYLSYTPALGMVIRTGTATIEVDSLDSAITRVRGAALTAGGYLADLSMHSGAHQLRQATLQVKIPAERFEDLLSAMEPIGEVQALNVSAQDVSEEFVDLRARAANDARLEARLIELLDKRTGDLAEVLTVERELARVRSGIEQVEGRLRYLQERAHMSTLQIQLHEAGPLLTQVAGPNPIVIAVRQAWRNMIHTVANLIAIAGSILPFALLALMALLLWKRYRPEAVARSV